MVSKNYAALALGGRVAILSGFVFLLGACYTYRLARGPAPEPGTEVSIRLSNDATRDLALQLGPGVSSVEGVVLADDSAGLHLALRRAEDRGGSDAPWSGEQFTFPHNTYLSLEERHLNLAATVLVGGLAVGALVGMREAFFGTGGTANSPPTGLTSPSQ